MIREASEINVPIGFLLQTPEFCVCDKAIAEKAVSKLWASLCGICLLVSSICISAHNLARTDSGALFLIGAINFNVSLRD